MYNQNYCKKFIDSIFVPMMLYSNPDGGYLGLLLVPVALWVLYEVFVRNPIIERKEKYQKELEEEMKKQNRNRERLEPKRDPRRGSNDWSRQEKKLVDQYKQYESSVRPMVPKVNVLSDWFIDKWVSGMKISPAEQLIIDELSKYPVKWEREVSFRGFVTPKNSHYRYDFWLPDINTICEYHGKMAHMDDEKIANDKVKEEFCRVNSINLVVYRGKDYYHMEQRIKELLGK